MEKEKGKNKFKALFQIILLVGAIFSGAYFISETNEIFDLYDSEKTYDKNKSGFFVLIYERFVNLIFNEENFVSAVELSERAIENFRQHSSGASNENINQMANEFINRGYVTESELENEEAVRRAFERAGNDAQESVDSGNQASLGNLFDLLMLLFGEQIPPIPNINGNDIIKDKKVFACTKSKDNKICQTYSEEECEEKCAETCIEIDVENENERNDLVGECELGTCIDEEEGVCQPNSPKALCRQEEGVWSDQSIENLNECRRGCCVLGSEAQFITEAQCENRADEVGAEFGVGVRFDPEIITEPECQARGYKITTEEKGACVIPILGNEKKDCKFIIGEECEALKQEFVGTQFYIRELCSNSARNTICTKQNTTNCVEGLDEIYWFDSCGNRENIYEGSSSIEKERSWNNGFIENKSESCEIGTIDEPLRNQGTCGNCNRVFGSACGEKTTEEKLNDNKQGVVCLDLSCIDEETGKKYEHGESWCAYQSSIGKPGQDTYGTDAVSQFLPSNQITEFMSGSRATDTPGSRHFRKTCLNRKITTEPCGDNYRNEICVQNTTEIEGSDKDFSQAACRKNRWAECLAYNPSYKESRIIGLAGPDFAPMLLKARLALTCGQDPDCFVKTIDVADKFKFSYCVPRYPPGFDLGKSEESEAICAQATQKCKAVHVEGKGWEVNKDCVEGSPSSPKPSRKFIQEMNEFCVSLGDCGYQVNYAGKAPAQGSGFCAYAKEEGDDNAMSNFGGQGLPECSGVQSGGGGLNFEGFSGLPSLTNALNPYPEDAKPTPGEYIRAELLIDFLKKRAGEDGNWFDNWLSEIAQGFGINIDSLRGKLAEADQDPDVYDPPGVDYNLALIPGAVGAGAWGAAYGSVVVFGALGNSFAAPAAGFGSAFLGAAIGAATVGFLIDVLGIAPGLSPAVTYSLMGAGAVSGAIMAHGIIESGALSGALTNPIGWILAVVVIAIIIILKALGIGEVTEVEVVFVCKPWERPRNVYKETCQKCGEDELSDGSKTFPCNKYACEALGESCVYLKETEGPNGGLCEYAPKDDTEAPRIIELLEENVLSEGFEYDEIDLESANQKFEIKKVEGDSECVDQFESVVFGFKLDEYGKCGITAKDGEITFEGLVPIGFIGAREHTYRFNNVLDWEILGIGNLEPEEEHTINLKIVCQDLNGVNNLANPYKANICVVPRDLTAARITDISNLQDIALPYGATEREITIQTNERAECRWESEDKSFGDMQNNMQCASERGGNGLFTCTATIPVDKPEENICIKCLDHPEWEGTARENERNENQECLGGTIKRSASELQIDYVNPNNETIRRGTPSVTLTLEAGTSGGFDGSAECRFSINGTRESLFADTGGKTHISELSGLSPGDYNVLVKCKDIAGNTANKTTTFEVQVDTQWPSVTRVYNDDGNLVVVTDEPSECFFINSALQGRRNACNFMSSEEDNFNEIHRISIGSGSGGVSHSTNFDEGKTYYIKCKDDFDNEKVGSCNIIVRKGEV
ncbi:hypothetical protein HYV50_05405 [Candidatus Pacearchaeota archaeon]|nr:hypothetical protein [Candidatus Pacearchaeota archaeon]